MATEARVTAIIEAKDSASKVLGDITNSFSIFNGKVLGVVGAIGIASGALLKVANDTAEFNTWIARAGSNVDATAEQMAQFKQIAIDATRDTGFNATQAAAALYQLAGGSIDAKDAMTGLQQAVQFATANGLDNLDDSAIAVANIMTLFKLRGDDAARAMDVLTVAGHEAYGTTEELVAAFKESAPIAAQLGVSIEELSGLTAALADAGFRGTEAGVAMKRAMEQLINPIGDAKDDLQALGIKTQDASGNFVGLANVLDQLDAKTANLSSLERAAKLSEIFGQIAGPAMTALLSQGAEARAKYISDMEGAGGATAKAATAIGESVNPVQKLNQRFFEFENAIAPAALTVLNGLVGIIDILTPIIREGFYLAVDALGNVFYDTGMVIQWLADNVFNGLINAIDKVVTSLKKGEDRLASFIGLAKQVAGFLPSLAGGIGGITSNILSKAAAAVLPHFDQGGVVPGPVGAPMLAVVHGGETVIPTSGGSGGIVVNITGNSIGSNVDIRYLADQVGREVMRSLRMAQQI
jgi:TP901 family phage tail tape measure protein